MVRDEGRDAGRVGGAAGRGFGDAAEVPWRWFGGFRCAGRRFDSGARAGPWRGSAGHDELGVVPWLWFGGLRCAGQRFDSGARGGSVARQCGARRGAVASCLREIHLEPAIIDYQAVNSQKGPGEPNLVPPGTAMCLGVA